MTLFDPSPSVSWRLNDLLKAGKKAKAFAAASWNHSPEAAAGGSFTQWQPTVLRSLPDGATETEPLESPDQEELVAVEEVLEVLDTEEDIAEREAMVAKTVADQAKREAFEEGYQRGKDEGTNEAEVNLGAARDDFVALTQTLRAAQEDMTEFYQPLKKLALHLAEQLVRGELTLSSSAIERLTREALKDLEHQGEGPIVVQMNSADVIKFRTSLDGELEGLDLRADDDLPQGSVQISIDDSAIEDLITHRLSTLSEKLLGYAHGAGKPKNSTAFDSNFANPVTEKVIEGTVEDVNDRYPVASPVEIEATDMPPLGPETSELDEAGVIPADSESPGIEVSDSSGSDPAVPDTEDGDVEPHA
jgi:flagellar biosynthesis/type III secretory pathway protein FliH